MNRRDALPTHSCETVACETIVLFLSSKNLNFKSTTIFGCMAVNLIVALKQCQSMYDDKFHRVLAL